MNIPDNLPPRGGGFDLVALGEVMLRLDPGENRIRSARRFEVWEGGGEYNVARSLSATFGLRTQIVTSLVDNEVGHLIESLIRSSGVDTSEIKWQPFDGIGYQARNGLNFVERGFGIRGPLGVSDRGNSAASQLEVDDFEWLNFFATNAIRWFHTGGIFAGLSAAAAATAQSALQSATEHGTITSVDLNFRPSLWQERGANEASEVFTSLVANADVVIGGESDFTDRLGVEPGEFDTFERRFEQLATTILERFPRTQIVATSERVVASSVRHHWRAHALSREDGLVSSIDRRDLDVLDRVGSGDGLAAGLIYAIMQRLPLVEAVELAAAAGALAMTTPGDASMATAEEVFSTARGSGGNTVR